MNSDKIGKFIAELRKEKKLTQTELAERICVSNKTVSKWECGNAIPDYGVFENLCNEFNITVTELLTGERNVKDDKVVGEYINMKGKQNRLKIIVILVVSLLVILCSMLGIYFINSYDNTSIYQLSGSSKNFSYKDGLLVTSNIKNIFQKGKLEIKNNFIKLENISKTYYAFENGGNYYKLVDYDGDSIIVENYGEDLIIPSDMIDYVPNNLYLIVVYYQNENVLVDHIKIESKKIFSNNKFINLKSDPSKDAKTELLDIESIYDPFKYREQLIKEGFVEAKKEDTINFYGLYENGLIKKNGHETIFIDYINYLLLFTVEKEDYTILSVVRNDSYRECSVDTIGTIDLYFSGEIDGQAIYSRAYVGCSGVYLKDNIPIDISKEIDRYKELNKLYAYKDE